MDMEYIILGTVLIVGSLVALIVVPFFCDPGVEGEHREA